jgi:zinc/manganese transport system permease protein
MMGFDWSVLGAPLLAGLLVTATHVLLGRRVLERGIIFIDLSIAQVAAVGVIVAHDAGLPGGEWSAQVAAGLAALLAAGLLAWTESRWPDVQEALIGCLYVVAASAAILLVAHSPHGAEHFEELLAGQILWVGLGQVWPVALLYAAVLAAWFLWGRAGRAAFYFLFSLTVMASVQLIGVFLVFATLILPALAAHGLPERRGLALGYAIGASGYAIGLWLSVALDLPAGPLIVCVLAGLALAAAVARRVLRQA